jgi:D-alanyl-lipoteichoic acid acyltransferase DltB (MBOAT superfamily)
MIIEYVLIFIFQIVFNVFKTLEIRYTYENKLKELLINSVWINLTSLCVAYYSLDNLFKHNYFVIPVYILGSIIGKWLSMRGFDMLIKKKEP